MEVFDTIFWQLKEDRKGKEARKRRQSFPQERWVRIQDTQRGYWRLDFFKFILIYVELDLIFLSVDEFLSRCVSLFQIMNWLQNFNFKVGSDMLWFTWKVGKMFNTWYLADYNIEKEIAIVFRDNQTLPQCLIW